MKRLTWKDDMNVRRAVIIKTSKKCITVDEQSIRPASFSPGRKVYRKYAIQLTIGNGYAIYFII